MRNCYIIDNFRHEGISSRYGRQYTVVGLHTSVVPSRSAFFSLNSSSILQDTHTFNTFKASTAITLPERGLGVNSIKINRRSEDKSIVFLPHSNCGPNHKPALWSAVTKFRCRQHRLLCSMGMVRLQTRNCSKNEQSTGSTLGSCDQTAAWWIFQDELSENAKPPVKLPLKRKGRQIQSDAGSWWGTY